MEEDAQNQVLYVCYALSVYSGHIFMNEVTCMTKLLTQAKENLSFIVMCVVIVAALSLLSRFAEGFFPQKRSVTPARRITIISICASIATVLHVLDISTTSILMKAEIRMMWLSSSIQERSR